jgi:uncharacterized glyoxalase superfamily protein PhnB
MEGGENYSPIMPYLVLVGAKDFIQFAKDVLGATEKLIVPREDGTIMHGELRINGGIVMIADANDVHPRFPAAMSVVVKDLESIYDKAIARGAISLQEVGDRGYGKSAGFEDPFGNRWWLMTSP